MQLLTEGVARDFHDFRELQKKFGLSDDQLLTAAGFQTEEGRRQTKAQIAQFGTTVVPEPQPSR